VGGQRVSGHRNRAGKSRGRLLVGAVVLLAECPSNTTTAQAQSALSPVTVDAPTQRPKPARVTGSSQRRTQAAARQHNRNADNPAAPTPSERAAAEAAAQQAAKLGYRAMPSATTLRSGASPLDSSQAVNVVPEQVLKDQRPRNIDDALGNVSGITQTNTLAGSQDAVIRRGFGDNRDGSIMRNGMPLIQGRGLNAAVESVEVLKGPATMLYGIMDPGGIVNTISKRPELYQHGSVTLLGSTYANNRSGADGTFDITGPIGEQGLAYRFIGYRVGEDYWRNFGRHREMLIAPSLAWYGEDTTVQLNYEHREFIYPFDSMNRLGQRIKAALLQVHSIGGLVLALLLALVALSGAIMSFEDELVELLNAGIMQVAPREMPALLPDELVARLNAMPDIGKVVAVKLSSDPSVAVHVRFARDEPSARRTSLYVDPYDARVLGAPRGEEFFATVRRLHRWLLIPGDAKGWGRQITGVAALGLIVMLISGVVLRWPRRATSVKIWLKPNLGLSGRGLHRSLHAIIGTWVLPIYLVMTLTGLWYSFDWYKDGVIWLLARPQVATAKMQPKQPRAPGRPEPVQPVGFDRAWTTFQREENGHFSRVLLSLPAGQGTMIGIRSWPKGSTLESMRDEFRIDAITGEVISAERYADKTFGEKAIASAIDIHRGAVLGWLGKFAFMIAAALMPLFAITGLLLYLSRRELRSSRQRAALGNDVADRTGERQVAAVGDAQGELDGIELRQVRKIARAP